MWKSLLKTIAGIKIFSTFALGNKNQMASSYIG